MSAAVAVSVNVAAVDGRVSVCVCVCANDCERKAKGRNTESRCTHASMCCAELPLQDEQIERHRRLDTVTRIHTHTHTLTGQQPR